MNKPERIVVHHSAGADYEAVDINGLRHYHVRVRGWLDIGYHLVIERVGPTYEAILGRPFDQNGAHCVGQNQRSIGVCFVGNYDDLPPPAEMLAVGAKHIATLMRVFNTTEVAQHRDFSDTLCPGRAFPIERLRELTSRSD